MQEQNNDKTISQRINHRLSQLVDFIMAWLHRALLALQRAWDWWQAVDKPEIPLTPLQWVLAFYLTFGVIYMWATPIFEASDELWHFGMVEYIAENGELPVQDPDNRDTIYRQEGSQPPLYYALAAALITPIDISDADEFRQENPYARAGRPGEFGNKNLVLHPFDPPPMRGTVLAVYLIRTLSMMMGVVTIWAVYQIGQLIAPHRPVVGLIAAVITAFNPMFVFISASVNNDTLVIMLDALVIWLGILTMRDGFDTRRSLAIALLIALATLTKLSALVIVPVMALGALWVAQRDKDWQGLLILGASMFVAWATIAGWWYYRNIQLYGELFGTNMMVQIAGARPNDDVSLFGILFTEFTGFRMSYWGIFGGFNIQTTAIFYALIDFAVFLAIFGVMFLVAQLIAIRDFSYARRELTLMLYLLAVVLIGGIALLGWTSQTLASQGRLMFPFIAAISPLLAVGMVELIWWMLFLLSPPDRSFVRAGDAVPDDVLRRSIQWPIRFLGGFALLIPFVTIAPAYRAPEPIDALPASDRITSVYADYGPIELVGYEHSDRRYLPGDPVRLTFYWRVTEQTDEDLTLSLTLTSPYDDRLGGIDTFPGAGTLRTSTWEVGRIYPDTYNMRLLRAINQRYPFRVDVNWYESTSDQTLTATNRDDTQIDDVMLNVGAVVNPNYTISVSNLQSLQDVERAEREFGDLIRLDSYNIQSPFTVELEWLSFGRPDQDYTAFVHVMRDGELVGQSDIFPELPTRYWGVNERYITQHPIHFDEDALVPNQDYEVLVGWYENDGDSFPRLLVNASDEENASDAYLLTTIMTDEQGLPILPVFVNDEGTPEPVFDSRAPEANDGLLPVTAPDVEDEPTASASVTEEATADVTEEADDRP
jgi:hypothetical protein